MFADGMLFITAANVLALFNLSDAVSLDGSDIKYDGSGTIRSAVMGFVCHLPR